MKPMLIPLAFGLALSGSPVAARPYEPSPFHLEQTYVANNTSVEAPPWCLNEDDELDRYWTGYLTGTHSATVRACDPAVDFTVNSTGVIWWNAGAVGLGIYAVLRGYSPADEMSLTSPSGVRHDAALVSVKPLSRTLHGQSEYRYSLCFNPLHDPVALILEGGTWTYTLRGSFSDTYLHEYAAQNTILASLSGLACP